MVSIGSNTYAMRAVRSLGDSIASFTRSTERLGSGLRINRASDDAAGLTVSSALGQRVRVYARANLNISDAVSLLNIADTSADQVSGLLSRMRELAEQAANGTLGDRQRSSLDKEYLALDQEIRRITGTTKFNGVKLLQGNAVSRALTAETGATNGDVSADGHYVVSITGGSSNSIRITDTVTGTVKTFSTSGGSAASDIRVANNGDIVYAADDVGATNLFRYSAATGSISKVTKNLSGSSFDMFDLADDGSKVVFSASMHYTNGGTVNDSPSMTTESVLSVLDLASGIVSTDNREWTGGATQTLSFSHDGHYVVVISKGDPLGTNNAGDKGIFLMTLGAGAPALRQLTAQGTSTEFSGQVCVADDGSVFWATADDLTGQNPSNITQFFKIAAGTTQIQQLSSFVVNDVMLHGISRDGSRLIFSTAADLDHGQNSLGKKQLYTYDLSTRQFEQQTKLSSDYFIDAVSADGNSTLLHDVSLNFYSLDSSRGNASFDFEVGEGSSGRIVASMQALFSAVHGLGVYTLTSSSNAKSALDQLARNLSNVAQMRGGIGASLSRLEVAQNLVLATGNELTAARSRIQDVDVSSESANLTRSSILQQVGAAIMAQANQAPALALTLLR